MFICSGCLFYKLLSTRSEKKALTENRMKELEADNRQLTSAVLTLTDQEPNEEIKSISLIDKSCISELQETQKQMKEMLYQIKTTKPTKYTETPCGVYCMFFRNTTNMYGKCHAQQGHMIVEAFLRGSIGNDGKCKFFIPTDSFEELTK